MARYGAPGRRRDIPENGIWPAAVIADELIAAADELRRLRGPEAAVIIVVGRSERGYHHVLGSVPQALERHDHFPVMVIP